MGRIHLGKQDLSDLQTRKMKGLKRARDDLNGDGGEELPDANEDEISHSDDSEGEVDDFAEMEGLIDSDQNGDELDVRDGAVEGLERPKRQKLK